MKDPYSNPYSYQRTILSIQNNPREKERPLAVRILSMMLSARRPLRWHEVQCAISIDPVQQRADWARRLKVHAQDVCGSLIQIFGEDRIEFVHATASLCVSCWACANTLFLTCNTVQC